MRRLLFPLVALALGSAGPPQASDEHARAWETNAGGTRRLQPLAVTKAGSRSAPTITVDAARRYQTMVGFGASITDASAILIQRLPAEKRATLMRELFGKEPGQLALGFTRLTIGASDFSPEHYSFDDMPPGRRDPTLAHFSLAPNRTTVLPTIRQALAINPDLVVMASPWSPPGWMKTGGSMIGGALRDDSYDVYARYFVRYLRDYGAAGVRMRYVTVQNEPDFSPDSYPGMKWSAAGRARFVGQHLGPALAKAGLDTQVLEWDHNWDQPQQPEAVLSDPAAARYVTGVAWHCYAGDVGAQSKVHDRYPGKDAFFTECSGGGWRPGWRLGFADVMKNLMIGSTRHWARGVLLWNLALDPAAGPHKGGCGNCRGVVTIDPDSGKVTRELEYYALGHLSRFVRPGAVRVDATSAAGLPAVAFRNPDGGRVLVVYNDDAQHKKVTVVEGAHRLAVDLPAGSAGTVIWR